MICYEFNSLVFRTKAIRKRQQDGTYKKEALDVFITSEGLAIVATSFSPFIIGALESSQTENDKKLLVEFSEGGIVKPESGDTKAIYTLTSDLTFVINPNTGYTTKSVTLDDVKQEFTDDNKITVKKESITSSSKLVVNFIEDNRKSQLTSSQYEEVDPKIEEIKVTLEKSGDPILNKEFSLIATVTGNYASLKYYWYKDGKKIENPVEQSTLSINEYKLKDNGNYKVEVVNYLGKLSSTANAELKVTSSDSGADSGTDSGSDSGSTINTSSGSFYQISFILSYITVLLF